MGSVRILYVTRKYPPVIGGMETVAHELYRSLAPLADVKLVAVRGRQGGKNWRLPEAYLGLFGRALLCGLRRRPDVIYLQDGVLAPLGLVLGGLLRRPTLVTIHGSELAYSQPLYDRLVIPALRRLTMAVAISQATNSLVRQRLPGVPSRVIHWGQRDDLYMASLARPALKRALAADLHIDIAGAPLIYLSGRLIERKGALRFVRTILPAVIQKVPAARCVIAGEGEDAAAIRAAITEQNLAGQAYLIGPVRGGLRRRLYIAADVFVMPNRPAYGFEGFGMVAVEAASCGTPVIASQLEGISDAVQPGWTGYLLDWDDDSAFIDTIAAELSRPKLRRATVRRATLKTYNWDETVRLYLETCLQLAGPRLK